jgi:hypothetical protein
VLSAKIYFLGGEIDGGFNVHAKAGEAFLQLPDASGKDPGQRAVRRPDGSLGTGVDQVGNSLRLRQVQFVIEECAFRKFPCARCASAQGHHPPQQHLQHDRPAVPLKLQHVLACE